VVGGADRRGGWGGVPVRRFLDSGVFCLP
jgi:hypothetical protein